MCKCDGYCNTKRGIFLFTAVLFVSTHIRSSVKSSKQSVYSSVLFFHAYLDHTFTRRTELMMVVHPCQERVMLTYCSKVLIYMIKSCNTVMNSYELLVWFWLNHYILCCMVSALQFIVCTFSMHIIWASVHVPPTCSWWRRSGIYAISVPQARFDTHHSEKWHLQWSDLTVQEPPWDNTTRTPILK